MTGDRGQGSVKKRGMDQVIDPEKMVNIDQESLLEDIFHRLLGRLLAAQKIVLEVAKIEISGGSFFTPSMIHPLVSKARKYVSKEMLVEVGVRKLVKRWEAEEVKR